MLEGDHTIRDGPQSSLFFYWQLRQRFDWLVIAINLLTRQAPWHEPKHVEAIVLSLLVRFVLLEVGKTGFAIAIWALADRCR